MMKHPVQPFKGLSPVQQRQKPEYLEQKHCKETPLFARHFAFTYIEATKAMFMLKGKNSS